MINNKYFNVGSENISSTLSKNKYFSISSGVFDPLNITGLQLYLAKDNSTVSSWVDRSPNAFDLVQASAPAQPTISANSVDFSVGDFMSVSAVQPLNDSSGTVFFSGYYDSATQNIYLASGDESTNGVHFRIGFNGTGNLWCRFIDGTTSEVQSTNTITNGAYFYGYIKSTGSAYEISLNGVIETIVVVAGSNDGRWMSNISGRDNLSVGALLRATPIYTVTKTNKIIYTNATLSTAEILEINNFMSIPENY